MVTLAKSLGNGVPIGACWARAEVADAMSTGTGATRRARFAFPLSSVAAGAYLVRVKVKAGPETIARTSAPGRARPTAAAAANDGRAPHGDTVESGPAASCITGCCCPADVRSMRVPWRELAAAAA